MEKTSKDRKHHWKVSNINKSLRLIKKKSNGIATNVRNKEDLATDTDVEEKEKRNNKRILWTTSCQ